MGFPPSYQFNNGRRVSRTNTHNLSIRSNQQHSGIAAVQHHSTTKFNNQITAELCYSIRSFSMGLMVPIHHVWIGQMSEWMGDIWNLSFGDRVSESERKFSYSSGLRQQQQRENEKCHNWIMLSVISLHFECNWEETWLWFYCHSNWQSVKNIFIVILAFLSLTVCDAALLRLLIALSFVQHRFCNGMRDEI